MIAPETLPLKEQISILKGARDVVCVQGTLMHLVLFCNAGTKLTILNRCEEVVDQQAFVNQAAGINCTFVDVFHDLLPTGLTCVCHILGPTKQWRLYLKENKFVYDESDCHFDISPFVYDYLCAWAEFYADRYFPMIKNKTAFDFLKKLNSSLLNKKLKRSDYLPDTKSFGRRIRHKMKIVKNFICSVQYKNFSSVITIPGIKFKFKEKR